MHLSTHPPYSLSFPFLFLSKAQALFLLPSLLKPHTTDSTIKYTSYRRRSLSFLFQKEKSISSTYLVIHIPYTKYLLTDILADLITSRLLKIR